MTLGVVLVNIAPRRSEELFATIRSFAEPIYVIFFVLVGARLNLNAMPAWLWGAVAIYVVGRSLGKIGGAYAGGRLTGAPGSVRRYAGMGLFAQGGIAVGLSIMAANRLDDIAVTDSLLLSDAIVFGVTASTIVLQMVGPPLIKRAGELAGEAGRDVTEEDVIESWRVRDAMNQHVAPITEGTPLSHVFQIFSAEDQVLFPVVDGSGSLKGKISLDELRGVMTSQETWDWVLAADVMAPTDDRVEADATLSEALDRMRERGVEQIPVVESEAVPRVVGVLDQRGMRIRVNEELVKRRQHDFVEATAS
jgi:CBS domain-containing protein